MLKTVSKIWKSAFIRSEWRAAELRIFCESQERSGALVSEIQTKNWALVGETKPGEAGCVEAEFDHSWMAEHAVDNAAVAAYGLARETTRRNVWNIKESCGWSSRAIEWPRWPASCWIDFTRRHRGGIRFASRSAKVHKWIPMPQKDATGHTGLEVT